MKIRTLFSFLSTMVSLGFFRIAQAQAFTLPNPLSPIDSLGALIESIADQLTVLIGSIAVIVFVYAGILFLISGGSEDKIKTAKKAVLYAVIGIAVALAGKAIINLVKYIITGT